MDPFTITAGLLGGWGLSRLIDSILSAGRPSYPVVIPPDAPWPSQTPAGALCPPNLPPPADCTALAAPYPAGLTPAIVGAWATKQLKYPKGTRVIDVVNGQLLVARLETHYHPPGMAGVTAWGCHRGATVYVPNGPWVQLAPDAS